MSLLDRLRPRWRDPDPAVRAAAVRAMGREERRHLASIAESDPDPGVRRVAIRRLDDVDLLATLATTDPDPALRQVAAERAEKVLVDVAISAEALERCQEALGRIVDDRTLAAVAVAAVHEPVRTAALARVASDRALRDVVEGAADAPLRAAALARIHDPSTLRAIVLGDVPAELALQALERIDDPDVLDAIAESASASKRVRRGARDRVPERAHRVETPTRAGDARRRQLEICIALETLADRLDFDGVPAQVDALEHEWTRLVEAVAPVDDVLERFTAARQTTRDRIARWQAQRDEAERTRAALAARVTLCEQVEALTGSEGPSALGEARAAWQALAPLTGGEGEGLLRRFRQASEAFEERHAAWQSRQGHLAELASLTAEAERLAAAEPAPSRKRWKALAARWRAQADVADAVPETAGLRARFDDATARLQQRRRGDEERRQASARDNLARLAALCSRLEERAKAEHLVLRSARRDLEAADAALHDVGPLPSGERRDAWTERLSHAHAEVLRRIRHEEETERWKRWANAGVQEQIIDRLEHLLAENDLAEGTRELGRLQDEWEQAATAPRDQAEALWQRFRSARNELRRRCHAWMVENQHRKEALCAEAAPHADSTAWKESTEALRELQARWKAIGPVPVRHAQALWKRFREPCDRFFARRAAHFERVDEARRLHATRKAALCERAEALAESNEWDEAAETLRALQAEWKQCGPAPRSEEEALWTRFRGACDHFFDRRRRRHEIEREERHAAVAQACDGLDALVSALAGDASAIPEDVADTIDRAWTAVRELDPDVPALGERVRAACQRLAAIDPALLRGSKVDPEATGRRREKLCARLEAVAAPRAAPVRELSLEERALRLRETLAAKTIGGAADTEQKRREDATAEARRLRASWERLGPVLDDQARALADRFEAAWARFTSDRR